MFPLKQSRPEHIRFSNTWYVHMIQVLELLFSNMTYLIQRNLQLKLSISKCLIYFLSRPEHNFEQLRSYEINEIQKRIQKYLIAETVNYFRKSSILDVCQGYEDASQQACEEQPLNLIQSYKLIQLYTNPSKSKCSVRQCY